MTSIGNVDQVLLLLREQLQRADRKRETQAKTRTGRAEQAGAGPLDRARALTALDRLGEDDARRAVVHGLLAEQFGEAVANDAAFQRVVDEVARIIGDAPGGSALIGRALAELRAIK
jgi:hypothetical protein